jgi:hypothetical protein
MFGLTVAVLLLAGCGGAPTGQPGEIIGVKARIPLQELVDGKISNLTYIGTVVVLLPDNEQVVANCTEEFLSDITGPSISNVGQFTYSIDDTVFSESRGFVATITIDLEEHQNVLLVRNEADEWDVTKVLK